MPKNWFITGAAGFIGSNLSQFILSKGGNVIGLDNFSTGKRSNVGRLSSLEGNSFRFFEGDIRDELAVYPNLDSTYNVVHLAAQVSVQKSIIDPTDTRSNNVDGFLRILNAAGLAGVKTFIYASSCAIYGNNDSLPLKECETPVPLSPYAESKLRNEIDASELANIYPNMNIIGLRFFNIFGPWQNYSGGYAAVIPKWIDHCLKGIVPIRFGDGTATRDYCYVDNISHSIWTIANCGKIFSNAIFNLGTGRRTSLNELFQSITKALNTRNINLPFSEPETKPWNKGDILHSHADISKIRDVLGIKTRITLLQGIDKLISTEYEL